MDMICIRRFANNKPDAETHGMAHGDGDPSMT